MLNRAARVASKASASFVLATSSTWALAEGSDTLKKRGIFANALGEFEMKGVASLMELVECCVEEDEPPSLPQGVRGGLLAAPAVPVITLPQELSRGGPEPDVAESAELTDGVETPHAETIGSDSFDGSSTCPTAFQRTGEVGAFQHGGEGGAHVHNNCQPEVEVYGGGGGGRGDGSPLGHCSVIPPSAGGSPISPPLREAIVIPPSAGGSPISPLREAGPPGSWWGMPSLISGGVGKSSPSLTHGLLSLAPRPNELNSGIRYVAEKSRLHIPILRLSAEGELPFSAHGMSHDSHQPLFSPSSGLPLK